MRKTRSVSVYGKQTVLWTTSRSRVPVDGAAIASDVRESSCREQKRRRRGRRRINQTTLGFFLTKTKDDDGPSKSLFNDELFHL
ncbi:hypothetical protein AVEN_147811-1 [Araneus ventricosus]|uniref:Uncharacterized protein n=1 Tax=Araneus ventricosus TaxID=182803 RepID=A0A4Y2V0F8_ARAVE|nr:hypothetical protein AVEN_140132-1 [Araneus ventricosus]GBO18685.1 hypothetical protein AVEN_147811-1 [Araneus ventricosus]